MYKQFLDIKPEVEKALDEGMPVVALESTIISHGMPYPKNVETALKVEKEISNLGVVPATIGIIDGVGVIGMTPEEIEEQYKRIADEGGMTVEEVKKHYEDPRSKEYLIDDTKENKLYDQLYKEVKVSKGDKISFKDLFNNPQITK